MTDAMRPLLVEVGRAFRAKQRFDEAAQAFESALREAGSRPDTVAISTELASAYKDGGKSDLAIRTLVKCAATFPAERRELLKRAFGWIGVDVAGLIPLLTDQWQWLTSSDAADATVYGLLIAALVYARAKDYPKARPLLERAGGLAGDDGERAAVAKALRDLGTDLVDASQLVQAADALALASTLQPQDRMIRWRLSEVMYRRSFPEPDAQDAAVPVIVEHIVEARRVWDTAARDDSIDPWALIVLALINEQLARTPGADRWVLGWEAALCMERCLLKGHDDTYDCVTLARLYRFLNMPTCAAEASRRAEEAAELAYNDVERGAALEERLISATNEGDLDAALELLTKVRERPNLVAWSHAVEGFIHQRKGDFDGAIDLARRAVADGFAQGWVLRIVVDAYREKGDFDGLRRSLLDMLEREAAADPDDALAFAEAQYALAVLDGGFERAAAKVRKYVDEKALPNEEPLVSSALVALGSGEIESGARLVDGVIRKMTRARELRDLSSELRYAAARHHDPKIRAAIAQAIADPETGFERAIDERIATLTAHPVTPADEMIELLTTRPDDDANGFLRVTAEAALARFDVADGEYESALTRYSRLLESASARFPEARRGLDEAASQILRTADGRLGKRFDSSVTRQYRALCDCPEAPSSSRADSHAALGYLEIVSGRDVPTGTSELVTAIDLYGAGEVGAASAAARLINLIRDNGEFWNVWDATDANEITRRLCPHLLRWFTDAPDAAAERMSPILLELGEGLIPPDAISNWQKWSLFERFVPALRTHFEQQWGVKVGGVLVRGNLALRANEYAVLLGEVPLPLERNAVQLDCRFTNAAARRLIKLGVSADDLVEAANPAAGSLGCWVRRDGWELAERAGVRLQSEPLEFVMEHLRSIVTRHLHTFVDLDLVEASLDERCASPEDAELRRTLLPTPAARFHFTALLRALVREHVPIHRLSDILRAIKDVTIDRTSVEPLVRRLRLRLRDSLPANGSDWKRIQISDAIREGLAHATSGQHSAAVDEQLGIELRDAIAAAVEDDEVAGVALVAAGPGAADHLRTIVHAEFVNVTALGSEEVCEPATTPEHAVSSIG